LQTGADPDRGLAEEDEERPQGFGTTEKGGVIVANIGQVVIVIPGCMAPIRAPEEGDMAIEKMSETAVKLASA